MTIKTQVHRESTRTSWKGISDDELNQVLSLSEEDPLLRDVHDLIVIIMGTGLRAGELRDLRWADFELVQRRFNIGSKPNLGLDWSRKSIQSL